MRHRLWTSGQFDVEYGNQLCTFPGLLHSEGKESFSWIEKLDSVARLFLIFVRELFACTPELTTPSEISTKQNTAILERFSFRVLLARKESK